MTKRKIITLIGRLVTPIIISKPTFWKHGCLVKVVGDPKTDSKPRFTSIGKLVYGARDYPTVLQGYRGYVKVSCVGFSEEQLKQKLNQFLMKEFLGSKTAEGYGRLSWEACEIQVYSRKPVSTVSIPLVDCCPQCKKQSVIYDKSTKLKRCITCNQTWQNKKFKIRKGLRADYPPALQRLLLALMLHDFVHTEKHPSKIYQEVTIEDEEIREACLNHHNGEESTNNLLPFVKYYDRLASYTTRKKFFRTDFRYDKREGEIDFQQLKQEIEEHQNNHIKLYKYIYNSQVLKRIVESQTYGKNNLRMHLLLMVNLAINDYLNGKLNIYKSNISLSASKQDGLVTAMDAEMHSFSDHDTANSERATTSMMRQLET